MFTKIFLVAIISAVFAEAQENNQICSCDTEQDIKDNNNLWNFLKKLSVDAESKDIQKLYAVSPGTLYQFDCSHCDEKLRKKRKIEEPEIPEETVGEEAVKEEGAQEETEGAAEEVDREKRYIKFHDIRCPKGYVRILSRYCMPLSEVDDVSDWDSK